MEIEAREINNINILRDSKFFLNPREAKISAATHRAIETIKTIFKFSTGIRL